LYPKLSTNILAILKVVISSQLQIGVNPFLIEPPTVHKVIQHGCSNDYNQR